MSIDDHTTESLFFLSITFIINLLILWTIFLLSLSRPASMQALSNSCLTTRLASYGEFFLNSLRLTISSLALSN